VNSNGMSRKQIEAIKNHPRVQVGIASYYGSKFHKKRTANGEIFNMYKISAAHKTYPLGTKVKVTNLENGKSIKLFINDRGPFAKSRILDLSYKAARKLDFVNQGTTKVRIEVIRLGDNKYHK
jgi:rare lipoprotein A